MAGEATAQQYNGQQQYNRQQPTPQYTQHRANPANAPRIDGFNVDEVPRLVPGAELDFTVFGTPGGTATLRIVGARRNLNLVETEPGQYEGTYTIGARDNIAARSSVTANLRIGNQVASAMLSESLQVGVGVHTPDPANANFPKIARFDVRPTNDLVGGNVLPFTLFGTPGGKAEIAIAGAKGIFFLPEVRSGEYAATYTIKRSDRIASNSTVTANLRVGDRVTTTTLQKPLMLAAAPVAPVAKICGNCGRIEAMNVVETQGDGNYLGTIGGGVVGALLGNQVGGGNGKTAATLAGAVGGALAGRAIEGNSRKSQHYEIVVRLQNGSAQTVSLASDQGFHTGDRVRINDGVMTREM